MEDGRDYLDLIVRSDRGVIVATTPTADGEELRLTGQALVEGQLLPVSLAVPLWGGGDDVRRVDQIQFISLLGEDELAVMRHTHLVEPAAGDRRGEGMVEVHSVALQGQWRCRATAVVDPLPLVPILAAVALGTWIVERRMHRDEMEAMRRQWERDRRECEERKGFPEVRLGGSTEWEVDLEALALRVNPRAGYEFRCHPPSEFAD